MRTRLLAFALGFAVLGAGTTAAAVVSRGEEQRADTATSERVAGVSTPWTEKQASREPSNTDTGVNTEQWRFGPAHYRPGVDDTPALIAKPAVQSLYEQLRACFPNEETDTSKLYDQAPCYEKQIERAANTLEPNDIYNAVNALVAERPDLFAACHAGGHKAAIVMMDRLWDPTASYDAQLEQFEYIIGSVNDVCQNGFVHGVYDAIGYAHPDAASFQAAAEICRRISMPFIDCGHGLGHSAWLATEDYAEAGKICGLFNDDKRYRCDDGVIMYVGDQWRENGMAIFPFETNWDPEAFYERIPSVCATWPNERAGDPNPLRGCWAGVVAGLIFRPISALIINADNDYFAVAEEMRYLARLGEAACIGLGPEGEMVCMDEWRSNIMFAAANDETAIRDFCSALRKHAEFCTELGINQLTSEREMQTESARNEANAD
jgi:hypothetical protein